MANRDFQGVLYDLLGQVILERSPCLRATYAEAMADAEKLVEVMNKRAEAWDEDSSHSATVARFDASYCFVLVDGVIAYSETDVA